MKFPFFSQFTTKINHQDWNLYSVEEDFNRYFADKDSTEWRISDVNTEFKVQCIFLRILTCLKISAKSSLGLCILSKKINSPKQRRRSNFNQVKSI